jgi:iron complex outermembrane recepter protein
MKLSELKIGGLSLGLMTITTPAWAQVTETQTHEIVITASKTAPSSIEQSVLYRPADMGLTHVIELKPSDGLVGRLDDLATAQGLGYASISNGGGDSAGLGMRGFTVNNQSNNAGKFLPSSRAYVDGQSDLTRRFLRDLSTVERVEVMAGQDATLLGSGAPGGSINYITKKPTGKDFATGVAGIGSNGMYSGLIDTEFGSTLGRTRVVGKVVRRDYRDEGVVNARENFFLTHVYKQGDFKLGFDYERLNDRMPFAFGTVYAGGKFWLDQAYVDTNVTTASRQYQRYAVSADYAWVAGTAKQNLHVYSQGASAHRDETLLGDYVVTSATTVSSLYRQIRDDYQQKERGVRYRVDWDTGSVLHQTFVNWRMLREGLDFSGPLTVAPGSIDLTNPNFGAININALTLTPLSQIDRNQEMGLALAHNATFQTGTTVSAGLRRISNQVDSAANGATLKQTGNVETAIHSYGLMQKIHDNVRGYLTRSESFEPVRAQGFDGRWLDPRQGVQWDTGLHWGERAKGDAGYVSLFTIDQTNLPATDPAHPLFLINLGSIRAKGAALGQTWRVPKTSALAGMWSTNLSYIEAGINVPTSGATQGRYITGTPHGQGSLRWESFSLNGFQPWGQLVAVGQRPGDTKASFYAQGYVRADMGARYRLDEKSNISATLLNAADIRYVQTLSGADDVWQGARRKLLITYEQRFN